MFDRDLDREVSERVKLLIKEQNWNNVQLANFLGLSNSSVHDILVGTSTWKSWQLANIAAMFCVTLDYLIFGDIDFTKNLIHKRTLEFEELVKKYKDNPSEIPRIMRLMNNENILKDTFGKKVVDSDLKKATKLISKKGKKNDIK